MTFIQDLNNSIIDAHSSIWNGFYKEIFKDRFKLREFIEDPIMQKCGADSAIWLQFPDQYVYTEEKLNNTNYPDFRMEFLSNDKTGAKGWICKKQIASKLLYVNQDDNNYYCYYYDFQELQFAWHDNQIDWKKKYGEKSTKDYRNTNYHTWFCPVAFDDPKMPKYELYITIKLCDEWKGEIENE